MSCKVPSLSLPVILACVVLSIDHPSFPCPAFGPPPVWRGMQAVAVPVFILTAIALEVMRRIPPSKGGCGRYSLHPENIEGQDGVAYTSVVAVAPTPKAV